MRLPKSRENYLDKITAIEMKANTGDSTASVQMLGLLVEAVVDLTEALEPIYIEQPELGADYLAKDEF